MTPRQFATVAPALCGTIVLAGWVVASLGGLGSASIESAGAVPIEDHRAPSLTANAEPADAPPATAMGNVAAADVAAAVESVKGIVTDATPASDEPEPIVEAALPDASQTLAPDAGPMQAATANTPDSVPNDAGAAVSRIEILDECLVVDICVDRYLWALYQRTPKEDTNKVYEKRKVTVRKKGKTVTVTRTFTRLVDADFTWKDPKAAERAGMPMMDYVIGGMDRKFKLKLFHTLHAAEQAGLSPGITSAFRDDYRQAIASGLKAASNRSYHGGSLRGGYGHGLAADIVSVKGTTRAQRWIASETLWKWVDAHGKEFGIGRPYLDRDPPHVAPIDGKEYIARRGTNVRHAEADVKKRAKPVMRADRSVTKRTKNAKASKGRTI
ncbi:D-alanyl-D-alanine carboxypeptidase family protein [Bradyrhizobium cenepequi]|uniref:D-alanyl-D-alanine carboxypeptidase family protein n=1 Tax=Bradyrhizobium cenepequi TaxID=2821403 RepID=UPI001CE32C6F|nr:D-alanyl-D-alanine carboxypeptidase family protein [Bradyrhizobium cenepequi]MCA6106765.1 peptidase M15 [Bradyrhizobium cenepequi]